MIEKQLARSLAYTHPLSYPVHAKDEDEHNDMEIIQWKMIWFLGAGNWFF